MLTHPTTIPHIPPPQCAKIITTLFGLDSDTTPARQTWLLAGSVWYTQPPTPTLPPSMKNHFVASSFSLVLIPVPDECRAPRTCLVGRNFVPALRCSLQVSPLWPERPRLLRPYPQFCYCCCYFVLLFSLLLSLNSPSSFSNSFC